jgi:isopentenyldiphosphate isomerase
LSEEYLEEWDWEAGCPTGRAISRTAAHRKGIAHEGVHLWIVSFVGGVRHVVLQRRSLSKTLFPGYLDITVGGHVPFGTSEGKIEKEAEEELGLELDSSKLLDLGYFRYEEITPEFDLFHREFQHLWLLHDDRPLSDYRFNDGEVDAVVSVPLTSFRAVLKGSQFCEGLFYGGEQIAARTIFREEFHPLFFSGPMNSYFEKLLYEMERV